MPEPAIHSSRIPGRQRLYLDVLYDPDRTGAFFLWPHPTTSAFEACARRLVHPAVPRARAAEMLKRQNREFGAPPEAMAAAAELAADDAVAVFTGQQAGLFGGPLYTIYKALTLLGWAARLKGALKRPVVPIFWIAADDHDFEEIRWTALPDTQNQVRRLELQVDVLPPRAPASQIQLGRKIETLLDELRAAQTPTEFSEEIFFSLGTDYSAENGVVEAFGRWMTRLLGRFGLVMFNPADVEAKTLCAPLFAREIEGFAETASALQDNGHRLEEYGYHRQVAHAGDHTHLFYLQNGRHALAANNGRLWIEPEAKTPRLPGAWLERLQSNPAAFSPGVLFRPVAQSPYWKRKSRARPNHWGTTSPSFSVTSRH
ncbi:MAG: bacillithiol biosynthesis BshC [candidate division Zixibacteria bacterium]|nr:bacillithiol biosynthesis BshC [candidate division Zixibacteria bacterium]